MNDAAMLQQAYNDTVRAFMRALDLHTPGEGSHAARVAVLATSIAHELGVDGEELVHLRRAAELHDVGKIGLDRDLLTKREGLTPDEIAELRLHALLALEVLRGLPWLAPAEPMVRHHHEWWDGTGYPDGLAGEEIPLGARIIAVAEAFDVMTMSSTFRDLLSPEEALAELRRCAGVQFDPAVVAAFERVQPLIQPI